jgi:hypothetical protein
MQESHNIGRPLLDGQYRPMTDTICLLECSAKRAAEAFHEWRVRTYARDGRKLHIQPIQRPNLETALDELLPLVTRTNRWLFLDTTSEWCAYFANWWVGTDSTPVAPLAGKRCGCRGIRATSTPNIPMKKVGNEWFGNYGAEILEVYRSGWTEIGNTERSICAMNDGGRWSFDTYGEPYDFENIEAYAAKRKRDRFTHNMLDSYLRHLGIDAYNGSFYRPNGRCSGFLLNIQGTPFPDQREYSLDGLRGRCVGPAGT